MTVDPSTVARYEQARANLWQAICDRNPQLALFSSPTGTEGSAGRTAEPRETGSTLAANQDMTFPFPEGPARDGSRQSCPAPEPHASGVVAASINTRRTAQSSHQGLRGRPQKGA